MFEDTLAAIENCSYCKEKQITLIRIDGSAKIRVCINPKCILKIDLKELKNWEKEK